nr:glycoside hydrolase family 5 protein [Pedobacter panaciterrae]
MIAGKHYTLQTLGVIILLLWSTTLCDAQHVSAVSKHGALKIQGGKIVDSHNKPPQLRGISLSWSIWGGRKYYTPEVVSWLKTDFNINLLRVAMAVEPDNGYLKDPIGQERLITTVIDAALEEGIYVLIDWHDHHANVNVKEAKSFFKKMSAKYSGVPNIIYEIWNEPERVEWKVVKDYALEVIAEIRKNDKENIIVVGSPNWDQDIDIAAEDPIKGFKNIAYSFHFYASDPDHQEKLMNKADLAISLGLPVMVTEWGVGEANGNGVFNVQKSDKWVNWMEGHKLSSANWNLTDKKETTALLLPGASASGQWPLAMLSPAGIYIRQWLIKLNKN